MNDLQGFAAVHWLTGNISDVHQHCTVAVPVGSCIMAVLCALVVVVLAAAACVDSKTSL